MIRFRLLGAIQLHSADGDSLRSILAQPKRTALLAYLAIRSSGTAIRRDTLLALFWPDLDDQKGRNALSQALYYLRRSLGEGVLLGHGEEELRIDWERFWCDVVAFRSAVSSERKDEALDLYRGELLPGFFLSGTPVWEQWLESERAELRRQAGDAAWSLAEAAIAAGAMTTAAHRCRQGVRLAPDDEPRLRRILLRLAEAGAPAIALDIGQTYARSLARDFGIDPSPETRAILDQIRSRGPVAHTAAEPVEGTERETPIGGDRRPAPRMWRRRISLAAVAVLAIVGLILGAARLGSSARRDVGPDTVERWEAAPRIAVLPFVDSTAAGERTDYLASAITEELVVGLSRLPGLRVIASTSTTRFANSDVGDSVIGTELGAERLVRGTVVRSGDSVIVRLNMVTPGDRTAVWTRRLAGGVDEIAEIRDRAVRQIAVSLGIESIVVPRWPTPPDAEAYEEYLRGRYYLGKADPESFMRARDSFVRALDLDPLLAPAYSGLAEAYNGLTRMAVLTSAEASPRAREAAKRALELDPDLSEAHAALAVTLSMYDWETEEAERHFKRALELDPSSASAHREYAVHLRNLGRFDEALAQTRTAQELDPLLAFTHIEEGMILYAARRYRDAIARYEEFQRAVPGSPFTFTLIALARAQLGQYDEALAALERADPAGRSPDAVAIRGYVYALDGRSDQARGILDQLQRAPPESPVNPFMEAVIHVALAEPEKALDKLEEARNAPSWHMRLLKVEPAFDPLRSDPRFQSLLDEVGLGDGETAGGKD